MERVLGQGAMGIVYAAHHEGLDRPVAVKILNDEFLTDTEAVERFTTEARAASAIDNPHIVRTLDFGVLAEGALYLVMEQLEGVTLGTVLKLHGPLGFAELCLVVPQILEGLGAAHRVGVVHRDLKPDNVLLIKGPDGKPFVKLFDFGIAKIANAQNRLTRAGQVFGTPIYMSPEQASGEPTDARSDIYSFGVMLYELVSGKVPFDAEGPMQVLSQHLHAKPPPLKDRLPDGTVLPPGLERVVLRCLEKNADARYQRVEVLLRDFMNVAQAATVGGGEQAAVGSSPHSSAAPMVRAQATSSAAEIAAPDASTLPTLPSKSSQASTSSQVSSPASSPVSSPTSSPTSSPSASPVSSPAASPTSSPSASPVSAPSAAAAPVSSPVASNPPLGAALEAPPSLGASAFEADLTEEIQAMRGARVTTAFGRVTALLAVGLLGALAAMIVKRELEAAAPAPQATVYVPVPAPPRDAHPAGTRDVALIVLPLDAHAFKGDEDLGATPLVRHIKPGEPEGLLLKRAGFEAQRVTLDGSKPKVIVNLRPQRRPPSAGSTSSAPTKESAAPGPGSGTSAGGAASPLRPKIQRSRQLSAPRREGTEQREAAEPARAPSTGRR